MRQFATKQDCLNVEQEMSWADRDVPATTYGLLTRAREKYGASDALTFQMFSGDNAPAATYSWDNVHAQVTQTANLFRALGVGPDDTVAYVLPNCLETCFTFLAGTVAGIANPINPLLEAEQIASILNETGAKLVVTLRPFPRTDLAQKVAKALEGAPGVTTVLEVDFNPYLTFPKSWLLSIIRPKVTYPKHVAVKPFAASVAKHNITLDFEDVQQDRIAAFFHTGGTTGTPKVTQHRYSGMIYNGWLCELFMFNENDNVLCPLPLFHAIASYVVLIAVLASGAHVIFPTQQGYRGEGVVDNIWKLSERWKISFIFSVPTAISAMMQRPIDADMSTIKTAFSGSSPLPVELFKRFESATDVTIVEGYGMTEATCIVACNPIAGQKKIGSVGLPLPYTDIVIVEETDSGPKQVEPGAIGEICVSSPGVFLGSTYTDPEKSRELSFEGTHMRTGDLGRFDEDGYLWVTGRKKDLIIRGGHNIDLAFIEEALMSHPAVAFVGAVGQPDAYAGEVPCAYVELMADGKATPEELLDLCNTQLSERAARPKHIEILPELPKTAVGKVFKPDLRDAAIMRVYTQALSEADIPCTVTTVRADGKLGSVACVEGDRSQNHRVGAVLGQYAVRWEWYAESASTFIAD